MRCGHRTLRSSEINEHFVGVDAHIDPRAERKFHDSIIKSAEIIQASPCCKGRCLEETVGIKSELKKISRSVNSKVRCGHRTLRRSSIKSHSVIVAHCDKCRKVMLRRGTVRAQFVGVDDLRRSSIKAQFVGVDAHIDPRAAENQPGPLKGHT